MVRSQDLAVIWPLLIGATPRPYRKSAVISIPGGVVTRSVRRAMFVRHVKALILRSHALDLPDPIQRLTGGIDSDDNVVARVSVAVALD